MATAIVQLTDKNFRVTIPMEIREIEGLEQGDYIQIDVVKIDIKDKKYDLLKELNNKIDELLGKIAEALRLYEQIKRSD